MVGISKSFMDIMKKDPQKAACIVKEDISRTRTKIREFRELESDQGYLSISDKKELKRLNSHLRTSYKVKNMTASIYRS